VSPSGEEGTTLVELLMALALTTLALGLVLPLLGSSADQAALSRSQSQATGQLSSLLQALGNEVGSAAVVYSPAPAAGQTFWAAQGLPSPGGSGVGPGDALLVLSQYDPATGGSGAAVCDQWAVEPAGSAGALVTRSWSPGQGGPVPFEVVAPTPWPPPAPPFELVSVPGVGVQVHLTLLGLGRDQSSSLTVATTMLSMDMAQPGLSATACEQGPDP
jgi:type II secretory pathway pseudopilin PulG